MLMIRPRPAGIMCASASCVRTNAPPRFTSIARHHSAVWSCHNGPTGPLMPALLTRMSTVPSFRRSSVTAAAVARWSVTSATAAATIPSSGRPSSSAHSAGARIAMAASVPMAVLAGTGLTVLAGTGLAVRAGTGLAVRAGVALGEQPAQDLPRGGLGNAVGELDLARPFVAGHALGHPRHQLLRRCRGPQHDKGLGYLPGQLVGPAD